jgi:hypothetical protein
VLESVFRVFRYVMLKPAALEYVVLFPVLVVVAGIGVGEGVVLVAQPAVVAATANSATTASATIRLRLFIISALAYMEIF